MTAITVKKSILKGMIERDLMLKYDSDPGTQRLIFQQMVHLTLSHYSLRELRSWWEILTHTKAG